MKRNIILIVIFALILVFSILNINIDMSIYKLLPENKILMRTVSILEKSPVADKVLLYIDSFQPDSLQTHTSAIQSIIDSTHFYKNEKNKNIAIEDKWTLSSVMPKFKDINDMLSFAQDNSLLLYPYELLGNPFTKESMVERLVKKENYLDTLAFSEPTEEFFNDPLVMGFDFLSLLNINRGSGYATKFDGVVANDGKAYIKIFNAYFLSEDYENSKSLYELDKKINEYAKKNGINAFLYCPHLYYLESYRKINSEISLIFIFSIILTFLVFYLFFNRISILLYAVMPILGGFALTFLTIAIFKKNYGGISIAFGATIVGIAIDYVVHYISKITLYPTLKEFREKVSFSLFLGCGTTLLIFIILLFSDIASLQEIGLIGFLGVLFCFLLAFFVLQSIIPPEKYKVTIRVLNMPKTNKYIFIGWVVFIIIIICGVIFGKFENDLKAMDNKHPKLDNRIAKIQNHFNQSTFSNFLVFTTDNGEYIDNKEYFNNKDKILENASRAFNLLYKNNREFYFMSPSFFYVPYNIIMQRKEFIKKNFDIDLFKKVLSKSDFQENVFDNFISNIKNIDSLEISGIPLYIDNIIDKMFIDIKGQEYLLIQINNSKNGEIIESILENNNINYFIVNAFKDSAEGLVDFEKKAVILIFIALILIMIILFVVYKNIFCGLLAILPPLMAVLSCIATATFTGRGVNIMHITSSIILIGIGVDYGIYVTTAFKHNYSDKEKNMTYQSILICALTTLAGFGVLTFSSNQAVFSLGSGMFAGIVTAFLTSYLVIPFLYEKFK